MSAYALLTSLRNERIARQRLFHEKGMFPGPEPAIELPIDKVLVDRKGKRLFICLDELIKIVSDVIMGDR